MLERLVLQLSDAENYLDMFIVSGLFTLLSIMLVHHVVPFKVSGTNFAGLLAVLITSLAMAYPFVSHLLRREKQEAENQYSEKTLIARHGQDLVLYLMFFLGATVAFALSTFFVPESFYAIQDGVLQSINGPTGNMIATGFMMEIIQNNLWVFAVTFVLTFFVSSGVIFVLIWNASVLGIHIGNFSESLFHVPLWTLPYLPHGLLEVGGYVLAGIAGALLSYEVEGTVLNEHDPATTWTITKDVLVLLLFGVVLILLGGFVEVINV